LKFNGLLELQFKAWETFGIRFLFFPILCTYQMAHSTKAFACIFEPSNNQIMKIRTKRFLTKSGNATQTQTDIPPSQFEKQKQYRHPAPHFLHNCPYPSTTVMHEINNLSR
jgi:hypothetical protein